MILTLIRRYEPSDLPLCAEIFASVYNNSFWQTAWTPEGAAEYLSDITESRRFLGWTLEEDGRVCGAALCQVKAMWSGREIYIDEIFISSNMQRRGAGSAMLAEIDRFAREGGYSCITLLASRRSGVPSFYRRCGFSHLKHIKYMYKFV